MTRLRAVSLLDVAFLLGPLCAPVLTVLAVVILFVARPVRWAFRVGIGLAGLTTAAWLTYWFLWGKGFDYADSGGRHGWPVGGVADAISVVCAAACLALLGTVVVAFQRVRGSASGSS